MFHLAIISATTLNILSFLDPNLNSLLTVFLIEKCNKIQMHFLRKIRKIHEYVF